MSSKPPNILIYCLKNQKAFESISHTIKGCIGLSKYAIYQLDDSEPWHRYCSLVVVASHPYDVPHNIASQIKRYSQEGGKVISVGGYFSSLIPLESFEQPPGPCLDDLLQYSSNLCIGQGKAGSFILLPVKSFYQQSILSKTLESLGILIQIQGITELQSIYAYSHNSEILKSYFKELKERCSVDSNNRVSLPVIQQETTIHIPVLPGNNDQIEFYGKDDKSEYKFPELFLHSKAVTSTQDLLWNNSLLTRSVDSIAFLADVQLSGKGRGDNHWISPTGSMCFSFYFTLPSGAHLTRKLPFVQYITALAALQAANDLNGSPLDIKIKWPNDIYTSTGIKIGGILVNCSSNGSSTRLCVGIGMNVNNADPTTSLSKMAGKVFSIPKLAKKLCSYFCEEVSLFNDQGHQQFIDRFCMTWLHQDKEVKISVGSLNCDAVIKSLDSDGYLSVLNLASQKLVSVQPDGNSFDMLENMIAVKTR